MSEIKVSQVTEIENSELREFAMRVVLTMQLAAEKATAHQAEPATYPISSDPNSFGQLFLSRFQQLDPKQQQAGISNVMAAINAPEAERVRVYGDLAKVDLRSETAVEAQTENLLLPDSLKSLQIETNSPLELPDQVLSRTAFGLTHTLELRIHRVKCIEDTNEWGKDEISLGGSRIDESANTEKISDFKVGKFKRGVEVNYSPPRIFTTFDLLKSPSVRYPRSYFATLVLAEIDFGGFSKFLNALIDKIKEVVIEALTPLATALGTTIGAMIGSGIPILGTAIGAAIGAIIGFAIGKIVDLIKSWWNDDIFKPITLRADVSSLNANWQSPQDEVKWEDFGGEYRLWYDWSVKVPPQSPTLPTWAVMGNELISGVGVSSWKPEVMDLFVRGTDNLLYYKWYDSNNGGWMQGYQQLGGGQISFSPVAVSGGGSDLVDVFARGIGANDGVYHKVWKDSVWSDWKRLGSMNTLSGPGLSWEPTRRLDVFVRGTDNALYVYQYNPTIDGWEGPWPLDGQISSSPAAIALANGPVHVFARGMDNALWHRWYDGGWQNWESLGGPLGGQISPDPESGPSVSSWGPRRLDVFVRGTDDAVWRKWSDNGGASWSNWESLGGTITSSPASISRAPNLIEVFVRGTDSKLYHVWWDGTAWRP